MARRLKEAWSGLLGSSSLIFVTTGSMFPFDRMIRIMDNWASQNRTQDVLAQIGGGSFEPKYMNWKRIIPPDEYKEIVKSSQLIVAHAGTGSVFTAAEFQKPIVLMPRRAIMKEHTTDHQLDTAKWLEGKPGIFIAWDEADLTLQIERANNSGKAGLEIPLWAPQPFLDRVRNFLVT